MSKKPRIKVPKKAAKGEIVQIKTLISHNMETGTRKDKSGKLIPRNIINKFTCTLNGKEVLSANLYPSVAANPYFAFHVRATESGTFEFTWTDDEGKEIKASNEMTVA
ncbi:MAG: thiosulfate oxidation carrier complex protein SoxZ [Hyphomicrobiales bacterium]|nr:thiosulfate oxidation carrier complex protein SoxZ [Hyphomicrobiales bacterium]